MISNIFSNIFRQIETLLVTEYYKDDAYSLSEIRQILCKMYDVLVQRAECYLDPDEFFKIASDTMSVHSPADGNTTQFIDSLIVLKTARTIISSSAHHGEYEDSLVDLANYCIIALSLLDQKQIDYSYFSRYQNEDVQNQIDSYNKNVRFEGQKSPAHRVFKIFTLEDCKNSVTVARLCMGIVEVLKDTTRINGLLNLATFAVVLLRKHSLLSRRVLRKYWTD